MKKNTKKYAMGGDTNPLVNTLLGMIPQGANLLSAATTKPTYSPGSNNQFGWGNVISSALAGGIGPQSLISGALAGVGELIRDNKRDKTTVYGSPGQYAMGGPIDPLWEAVKPTSKNLRKPVNVAPYVPTVREHRREDVYRVHSSPQQSYIEEYINSPIYARNLSQIQPSSSVTSYKNNVSARLKRNKILESDNMSVENSAFSEGEQTALIGRNQKGSKYKYDSTMLHELSHSTGLDGNNLDAQDSFISAGLLKHYGIDSHDRKPQEYKADVDAVRYMMYKQGIYNPSQQEFKREYLEKAKNNKTISNDAIFQRLINNSQSEEAVIRALKDLADNSENGIQTARYGGHLDGQGFAYGGDMQLNRNSFKVDAPANQTDVKYYPQFNAKLDNNEVVDATRQIVYSDKLTNPRTGNTYAKDAEGIERMKGEAQKKVTRHKDRFAEGSVSLLDQMGKALYSSQEVQATAKGHRPAPQGHVHGGPLDPISMARESTFVIQPPLRSMHTTQAHPVNLSNRTAEELQGLIDINRANAYKTMGLSNSEQPISRYTKPAPIVRERAYGGPIDPNWRFGPINQGLTSNEWFDWGVRGMPNGPDRNNIRMTLPEVVINGHRPSSRGASPKIPSTATQPINGQPYSDDGFRFYAGKDQDPTKPAIAYELPNAGTTAFGLPESLSNRVLTSNRSTDLKLPSNAVVASSATNTGNNTNGFTTGDYLQMGSALASFAPLLEGPKRETPYMDNTQITKNAYDVQPQLYQSNRSYRNAVNSIDTQSPNTRRALQNALLSQKLNNDNQVIEQYQNMNNQANTEYENRLSNQRRYNIGQQTYTDDLNTRNQAAWNTSLDNAFRSVANFGSALNQRQEGRDVMALYKETYSDVYDRIMNALTKKNG